MNMDRFQNSILFLLNSVTVMLVTFFNVCARHLCKEKWIFVTKTVTNILMLSSIHFLESLQHPSLTSMSPLTLVALIEKLSSNAKLTNMSPFEDRFKRVNEKWSAINQVKELNSFSLSWWECEWSKTDRRQNKYE